MATAHLSVKVGKAGKGTPHAEYISRVGKYEQRLEQGEKLEMTESGNMPYWAENNPMTFWQAADLYERKNGYVYREHEIALPRELNQKQRIALVRDWVEKELGDRHAYTWAIHNKTALDGKEQPHVHLMFSERINDKIDRDPEQYFKRYNPKFPERGGAKKAIVKGTYSERAENLKAMRDRWEKMHNAHVRKSMSEEEYFLGEHKNKLISMKSLAEQGIDRKAEPHMTPSESAALQRKAAAERAAKQVLPELIQAERERQQQQERKRQETEQQRQAQEQAEREAERRESAIKTKDSDPETVARMLEQAKAKNWDSITVKGTPEFRKLAWEMASIQGIEVKGYNPTSREIEIMEVKKAQIMQQQRQEQKAEQQCKEAENRLKNYTAAELVNLYEEAQKMQNPDELKKAIELEKIFVEQRESIKQLQSKIDRANDVQNDLKSDYHQYERKRGLFSKGFEKLGFKDDLQEQRKDAFAKNVQLIQSWKSDLENMNREYEQKKEERAKFLLMNAISEARILEKEIKERPLSEFQAAFNAVNKDATSRAAKEKADQVRHTAQEAAEKGDKLAERLAYQQGARAVEIADKYGKMTERQSQRHSIRH